MQPQIKQIDPVLLSKYANRPWPVARSHAQEFLQYSASVPARAQVSQSGEILSAIDWLKYESERCPIVYVGGVAIISMVGFIEPYSAFAWGHATVDRLSAQIDTVARMPNIHTIVIFSDSPGGDGTGVPELAEKIYSLRATKHIVAYSYGLMASAAYWIGSAAHSVVGYRNSLIGSIGIVTYYYDWTKFMDMMGITEYEILYSGSPKKNPDPSTDDGRAQIQAMIDDYGDVFVADIAKHRGVESEDVLKNFGQGGVFVGEKAVTAGLADAVMPFEELIDVLSNQQIKLSA